MPIAVRFWVLIDKRISEAISYIASLSGQAGRSGRRCGLKPAKYALLTLKFGFFVWVRPLRDPKVEDKSETVDA